MMSSDLYRQVALEADAAFVARSQQLVGGLPEVLRGEARNLLTSLQVKVAGAPERLIYIPIGHDTKDLVTEGRLESEVTTILEDSVTDADVIVSGEHFGSPLNLEVSRRARINTLRRIAALGFATLSADNISRLREKRESAFSRALLTYVRKHAHIRSAGFESRPGAILASVFDRAPHLIPYHADSAYMNETTYRFGIEARTRHSLNRGASFAGKARLVFIQGSLHLPGVEGWAERFGVPLTTVWPPALKPMD